MQITFVATDWLLLRAKVLVVVSNPRFEKFFDFFFEIRRPHSTEETSTDEEKFGFDI